MTGISVVIPNYNGKHLFPHTLPTVLHALSLGNFPHEIIISDDASTDGSVAYLQENYPTIRIVSNNKNAGFSVTANAGIRAAIYPWVFLLNSDVKLEPDYFKHVLPYTERKNVFGVMGKIIGWDDDIIQDGAKYPIFHGVKIKTSGNYLMEDEADMKNGIYSMYISGANALLNKEIFDELGGFNEIFSPFYIEDYELSLRAWRSGYECYYEHFAVCRHKTSTTIKTESSKKFIEKIYNRNKMFLHAIHLDAGTRMIWFIQLFLEAIGRAIILQWTFLTSISLFMKDYQKVRSSRENFHSKRKKFLSVNEVADRIKSSIGNKRIRRF
jgi:GT2 family glycosyltransferase